MGFRVVADEVRKRAEQSAGSADEVRSRVRQTQDQITQLLGAMQEGRRTAQGVGAVSAAVRQALDAIFADLNETVTFATAFAGEDEGHMRRLREQAQSSETMVELAESTDLRTESTCASSDHGARELW